MKCRARLDSDATISYDSPDRCSLSKGHVGPCGSGPFKSQEWWEVRTNGVPGLAVLSNRETFEKHVAEIPIGTEYRVNHVTVLQKRD